MTTIFVTFWIGFLAGWAWRAIAGYEARRNGVDG